MYLHLDPFSGYRLLMSLHRLLLLLNQQINSDPLRGLYRLYVIPILRPHVLHPPLMLTLRLSYLSALLPDLSLHPLDLLALLLLEERLLLDWSLLLLFVLLTT